MKIALGVEYYGNNYHGWQKQNKVISIQEILEIAIAKIANHAIKVICGGRTDKGVHSVGQVVHFKTVSERNEYSWIIGINSYLPKDISIRWVKKVPDFFNARYSAIYRFYRYIIYNSRIRSALFHYNTANFFQTKLNIKKMNIAGTLLIGEHDFSSFRSIGCQSKTAWRNISYLNVFREENLVVIDIKANSFLYHMVRNIAGCLIAIGSSKKKMKWVLDLLELKDRKIGGVITAPACGLYLIEIKYPNIFEIPRFYSKKII
ncbi:tRNA pseudouridine(38-40) synthase TruA [Buchnera aphidicola (Hormaphis cornu)]|nr:tRNA pseudouridine(38-40) synthase TruA [Buchnera aphidicola (Hormaphis cornu)]